MLVVTLLRAAAEVRSQLSFWKRKDELFPGVTRSASLSYLSVKFGAAELVCPEHIGTGVFQGDLRPIRHNSRTSLQGQALNDLQVGPR